MVRVLHVSQVARAGVGTCIDLIYQMRAEGHEHLAVVPESEASDLSSAVPTVTYSDQGRGLISLWRLMMAARRAQRDFDPDLVFVHSSFAMVVLPVVTRGRAKVIYCAHGWAVARYDRGWKRALVRQIEGRLPALADVVVNCGHHEASMARDLGYRGAHRVIENAVPDLPSPAADVDPLDPAKLNILFVGRFARQKGLDVLCEAMALIGSQRPDIELIVVGGDAADAQAAGVSVPAGVTLKGWQSRPVLTALYQAADAVILPSRWEGLPMVLLEAWSMGTPVLVSRRAGMEELVQEGQTGHSFELMADAIAARLGTLDKSALAAMAPACRAEAEGRFSPERYGAEMAALFAELSGQKNPV